VVDRLALARAYTPGVGIGSSRGYASNVPIFSPVLACAASLVQDSLIGSSTDRRRAVRACA
jgi:hypothetical protein